MPSEMHQWVIRMNAGGCQSKKDGDIKLNTVAQQESGEFSGGCIYHSFMINVMTGCFNDQTMIPLRLFKALFVETELLYV